jgi:hypothetical protein
MRFFDNKEVRKVVRMTTVCGENYIRTQRGGVKETTLPHRTFFSTKLIPKLDKLIDAPDPSSLTVVSSADDMRNHHSRRVSKQEPPPQGVFE